MDPTEFSADELCHLVLEMFQAPETGVPDGICPEKLRRFILAVRARMFENPYHNWCHVVDVAQTAFALLLATGAAGRHSPLERFALLCASLAHDFEHPGVTSHFLSSAGAEIAGAVRSTLLEKHHALRAFEVLSARHYNECMISYRYCPPPCHADCARGGSR